MQATKQQLKQELPTYYLLSYYYYCSSLAPSSLPYQIRSPPLPKYYYLGRQQREQSIRQTQQRYSYKQSIKSVSNRYIIYIKYQSTISYLKRKLKLSISKVSYSLVQEELARGNRVTITYLRYTYTLLQSLKCPNSIATISLEDLLSLLNIFLEVREVVVQLILVYTRIGTSKQSIVLEYIARLLIEISILDIDIGIVAIRVAYILLSLAYLYNTIIGRLVGYNTQLVSI